MKIILLQDIKGVGKRFDVKNVADGYALNKLIPGGAAREATAGALKQVQQERSRAETERKVQEDLLIKNLSDLEGKTVHISAKASDKGHLFAAIHEGDIARRLKEELHVDAQPDNIELAEHLKTVGEHEAKVKVGEKKASFKIIIEAGKE